MWKLSLVLDLSVLEPLSLLSQHSCVNEVHFALCWGAASITQRFCVCCACLGLQKYVLKSCRFQPVLVVSCLTWCNPYPSAQSSFNCGWSFPPKWGKATIFWSWTSFCVHAHWKTIFIPGCHQNILWKETKCLGTSRKILGEATN